MVEFAPRLSSLYESALLLSLKCLASSISASPSCSCRCSAGIGSSVHCSRMPMNRQRMPKSHTYTVMTPANGPSTRRAYFFTPFFFFFCSLFFFSVPLVPWSFGPLVLWSRGPLVPWSFGPVVPWSSGSPGPVQPLGPLVFSSI